MFDDCKGERLQELLLVFSTIVLRKMLSSEKVGAASIAGRLCLADKIPLKEHASCLPLAIAHRASLTALLRRKKELRSNYHAFGRLLDLKGEELDQKFDKVVETQGFLDENIVPEHTVSRVAKVFDKHWHGDSRYIDVIAQGEEFGLRDSLLDKKFTTIWPQIGYGAFDGDVGSSRHGLLEDLERRVASQDARLQRWRTFKEEMQKNLKPAADSKAQDLRSPQAKSRRRDLLKEKDLVFSPRKSPRKSMWPPDVSKHEEASADLSPAPTTREDRCSDDVLLPTGITSDGSSDHDVLNCLSGAVGQDDIFSTNGIYDSNEDSGFSEISRGGFEMAQDQARSEGLDLAGEPGIQWVDGEFQDDMKGGGRKSSPKLGRLEAQELQASPDVDDVSIGKLKSSPRGTVRETQDQEKRLSQLENEESLAEQIISLTINAAPTPIKPKLSLIERTRQSMAFASPGARLTTEDSSDPPMPAPFGSNEDSRPYFDTTSTLLERTRQSISLAPSRPRGSRKSIHDRRASKVYPTNQFETPKKQATINELTPPEELFSAGAAYDSVFKSRPKIAFSPTSSPVPDGSVEREDLLDTAGQTTKDARTRWEDSPLARLTTKV